MTIPRTRANIIRISIPILKNKYYIYFQFQVFFSYNQRFSVDITINEFLLLNCLI